jgi:hypothetical protein
MKRGAWGILLISLFAAASANAEGWKPYVGLSIQPTTTFALQDSSSTAKVYSYRPAPAYAGQIEMGLFRKAWEVYVGYHFSNSYEPVYSGYYGTDYYTYYGFTESNRWKDRRIVLGGRWYPTYESTQPIQLILGTGLTLGYSYLSIDFRRTIRHYGYYSENEYTEYTVFTDCQAGYSKLSVGQLTEFGFIVDLFSNFDFRTTAQLHIAGVSFDQDDMSVRLDLSFR